MIHTIEVTPITESVAVIELEIDEAGETWTSFDVDCEQCGYLDAGHDIFGEAEQVAKDHVCDEEE